jgi:hypothetical protein
MYFVFLTKRYAFLTLSNRHDSVRRQSVLEEPGSPDSVGAFVAQLCGPMSVNPCLAGLTNAAQLASIVKGVGTVENNPANAPATPGTPQASQQAAAAAAAAAFGMMGPSPMMMPGLMGSMPIFPPGEIL